MMGSPVERKRTHPDSDWNTHHLQQGTDSLVKGTEFDRIWSSTACWQAKEKAANPFGFTASGVPPVGIEPTTY